MLEYKIYGLPLLIPVVVASAVAIYSWRKREIPCAISLSFLAAAVSVWSFGYALEISISSLASKMFWSKVEYLGIALVPVMLLVFALQYTGNENWITRRKLALLFLPSLILVLLVWTNEWHSLIWMNVFIDFTGSNPNLIVDHGPAFWLITSYSYLLVLIATSLLVRAFILSRGVYRKQALVLLLGSIAPWIVNFLYLAGFDWFNHMDMTPFAFSISALFYSWGIFRLQFLDLIPIARDVLIENMSDAVIVLDTRNRIVDINHAALVLIGQENVQVIGQPIDRVLHDQIDLLLLYKDTFQTHTEFFVSENETQRLIDLRISPIFDRHNDLSARLIVLRDISERWLAERAVQKARDELELRVKERTAEIQVANQWLQEEISERKATAEALAYRVKLEELITGMSTRFINLEPGETDNEIEHALQLIGEFSHVSRSYVFLFTEDNLHVKNTYEWCAPGIPPQKGESQDIPVERFPWLVDKIRHLEHVNISSASDLPAEALAEREFFEVENVQSCIILPMVRRGYPVGFLGFDSRKGSFVHNWLDEDIPIIKMVGEIFVNAFERKHATDQLEASLHEKDVLLKEIHHRVKNNLQIVSSILNLQAIKIKDESTIDIFQESQNRIRTMALIHEKLYRSENLAHIQFDEYLYELAASLLRTYGDHSRDIHLEIESEPVLLDIDTAIPCGLIINELVTNSLKHGFRDLDKTAPDKEGIIFAKLSLSPEHRVRLVIADNGTGFPEGMDFQKSDSLGLQIVNSLAYQLDGEVTFSNHDGARVEVNFTSKSAYVK